MRERPFEQLPTEFYIEESSAPAMRRARIVFPADHFPVSIRTTYPLLRSRTAATNTVIGGKILDFEKLLVMAWRVLYAPAVDSRGNIQMAMVGTASAAVAEPVSDFVDGRIYRDVEEMRQINAAAAEKGYLLVCDRCKNLSEPIVAVIAVANSDDAFGFCGDCYRKISEDFLGHVV